MKRISGILFCFITLNIYGQSDIITDRPDITESAFAIPAGAWQGEHGIGFAGNNSASIGSTLLRYGAGKNWELRTEVMPLVQRIDGETKSLIESAAFGIKVALLSDQPMSGNLAVLAHIELPFLISKEVRPGYAGGKLLLLYSRPIRERLSLGLNGGFYYPGTNTLYLPTSMSIGYSFGKHLAYFIEYAPVFENFENLSTSIFDSGFTWLLQGNQQVDLSMALLLPEQIWQIGAGYSWRIIRTNE